MSPGEILDFGSVFVFALTGALMASRAQLDPVGCVFVACLTAVGGGTVRDVLLDRNPIFWMAEPLYLPVATGAAGLVFFTAHLLESRMRTLLWLDSLALAIAVAAGCAVALSLDQPGVIVVLMGVVTSCLVGLMRDVVMGDVPVVLKQGELYVSAALGGAICLWAAVQFSVPAPWHLAIGGGVALALRAGSLAFGWRLPTYPHGPPKA